MKKRNRFAGLLLAFSFVLLTACQGPGAVQPSDTPTPVPTQSQPPQTVPWEVPQQKTLPYEEYFAQERNYEFLEHLDSAWFYDKCELKYEDGALYLVDDQKTGEVLWKICDMDNLEVKAVDYAWIYGIVDGKRLIRMDYWGNNQETLFVDESGLISTLNRNFLDPTSVVHTIRYDGTEEPRCIQTPLPLADGTVMYFWAGAKDGDGAALYRLYIPEKRADVMYQYAQKELDEKYRFPDSPELEGTGPYYRISVPNAVSNVEVRWSVGNPEFFQRFEAEVQGNYDKLTDTELIHHNTIAYHLPSQLSYTKNALTGDFQQVEPET